MQKQHKNNIIKTYEKPQNIISGKLQVMCQPIQSPSRHMYTTSTYVQENFQQSYLGFSE